MNCSRKGSQFAWGILKNAAGFWLVREVGVCLTFLEFQIQPLIEGKSFSGIFWRVSEENESIRGFPVMEHGLSGQIPPFTSMIPSRNLHG